MNETLEAKAMAEPQTETCRAQYEKIQSKRLIAWAKSKESQLENAADFAEAAIRAVEQLERQINGLAATNVRLNERVESMEDMLDEFRKWSTKVQMKPNPESKEKR